MMHKSLVTVLVLLASIQIRLAYTANPQLSVVYSKQIYHTASSFLLQFKDLQFYASPKGFESTQYRIYNTTSETDARINSTSCKFQLVVSSNEQFYCQDIKSGNNTFNLLRVDPNSLKTIKSFSLNGLSGFNASKFLLNDNIIGIYYSKPTNTIVQLFDVKSQTYTNQISFLSAGTCQTATVSSRYIVYSDITAGVITIRPYDISQNKTLLPMGKITVSNVNGIGLEILNQSQIGIAVVNGRNQTEIVPYSLTQNTIGSSLVLPRMNTSAEFYNLNPYYKFNDTHFALLYTNGTTKLGVFYINSNFQVVQSGVLDLGMSEGFSPVFLIGSTNLVIHFTDESQIVINLSNLVITTAYAAYTTPLLFSNGSHVITNSYGYFTSDPQGSSFSIVSSPFYKVNYYDYTNEISWMIYNPEFFGTKGPCYITKFDQKASTIQKFTLKSCPFNPEDPYQNPFFKFWDATQDSQGNINVAYSCNNYLNIFIVSGQSVSNVNVSKSFDESQLYAFPDYQNSILRLPTPILTPKTTLLLQLTLSKLASSSTQPLQQLELKASALPS